MSGAALSPSRRNPAARLGIGTATFLANYGLPVAVAGERLAAAPGDELLREAFARGVRYVDTATDYGDSERAVGRVVPPDVRVCTKISPRGSILDVQASLDRLGFPPDSMLMHSAGHDELASGPAIAALTEARARGMVRRIGASTYGVENAHFALAQPWVDAVQVEYSVLNQSVLRSFTRSRPDQEVVVRSVLCKGLLTSRRQAAGHLVNPVADAIEGIEACARDWGLPLETLAIRFALDTPGVDVVLVGVSTRDELAAALAAEAAPPLTREQWDRLAEFDRSEVDATHPERWERLS